MTISTTKEYHSFALRFLGCFCSVLWIIVHLHCGELSDHFCSICLNLGRECNSVHVTIHPAASISSHSISER